MRQLTYAFDRSAISRMQKLAIPLARAALFIVYFWFGALKVIGASPAGPLVHELFQKTMPLPIPFTTFYVFLALFEMTIGIIFLIRGWERLAIFLLGAHLFTTALPLLLLPHITWQGFLAPTLEGQYIIKNVLIVAAAVVIGSKLVPFRDAK